MAPICEFECSGWSVPLLRGFFLECCFYGVIASFSFWSWVVLCLVSRPHLSVIFCICGVFLCFYVNGCVGCVAVLFVSYYLPDSCFVFNLICVLGTMALYSHIQLLFNCLLLFCDVCILMLVSTVYVSACSVGCKGILPWMDSLAL